MKRSILFLTLFFVLLAFGACKSASDKVTSTSTKIHPHTALRKLEIDLIKVGDSLVKVEALLGKSTEKSSDPSGTMMVWYLTSDLEVEEQYYTLKEKPSPAELNKFIKLTIDPKNRITAKDFKL